MTNEVIKAMQGKKEHNICKRFCLNVLRVILFPVRTCSVLLEKGRSWLNSKEKWDETRAAEILNYYIPRNSEWVAEDKTFYFYDNGMGWNIKLAKKYLKLKDRRFWRVHCAWWGGEMRTFLIDKFELEGFTKKVGYCSDGWTEISFALNS